MGSGVHLMPPGVVGNEYHHMAPGRVVKESHHMDHGKVGNESHRTPLGRMESVFLPTIRGEKASDQTLRARETAIQHGAKENEPHPITHGEKEKGRRILF